MDIQEAADACRIKIIEQGAMEWDWNHGDYNLSIGHILGMLDKIVSGAVRDEKAHRWLGWAQACMCQARVASLDELKRINKEA